MKRKTLGKAKANAWKAFAKWYRLNATKDGPVECYTCDKPTGFKNIQPGHWIAGHSNATFININYIRPQCRRCNIFLAGNQGIFWERIEDEIGTDEFMRLRRESKQPKKMTVEEYEDLEKAYLKKIDAL